MTTSNSAVQGNSQVHTAFLKVYHTSNDIVDVDFNESWNNGTGYFDALAKADLGLEIGTRFRSLTCFEDGRKIVGVVTGLGNVVFFERYNNGSNGVIVSNVPQALQSLVPSGSCTEETFTRAAGSRYSNIAQQVDAILIAGQRRKYVPVDPRNPGDEDDE